MPENTDQGKIDFRVYIGVIFFRWQIIVLCFLYALFGGVLYIELLPKTYLTKCKIMIHRESSLEVASPSSPMLNFNTHVYLLQSPELRMQVVKKLWNTWGSEMGSQDKMMLDVRADYDRQIGSTLNVSIQSGNPKYAEAFLSTLMREHEAEWGDIQKIASKTVSGMLEDELKRLEESIKSAEDDVIEYQRLHDIARVDAKSSMESRYLTALMERKNELTTELMLLEAERSGLKDASAAVISDVGRLTQETGAIQAEKETEKADKSETDGEKGGTGDDETLLAKPKLPSVFQAGGDGKTKTSAEESGWQDLRVSLARLQQKEVELTAKFKPEHPELASVRKEIENVKNQLDVAAQVERGRLTDRHKALSITLNALETAEYNWKAKNLLASMRRADLKRLSGVVDRYDNNYRTLYSRLHDLRISEELKAEHFRVVEPVSTDSRPVWPDPLKILFVALVLGLGSGFGLAVLLQAFDNKVQTIKDVEKELGIPFLGGIPYWANSGLDSSIRPIVIEDNSIGAVEAYRSLRTTLLTAMGKQNEKAVFFTSADSKEGKTLTALNLAIMIAQMNKKVLLIDMDLRRGRLHKSLGIEKDPGFSSVMKDGVPLKSVIHETRFSNLYLVPTGATVENAAELFQTADVGKILNSVKDDYDYILVDTSPVLRVTDTVILSTQDVGTFLFVAHVNRTPKPMITYAITLLKDARILGLMLNSIEMHRISSLYYAYQYPNYAYYSNAYRYGYDYGDESGDHKRHRGERQVSWETRRRAVAQWMRRTFLPMD
jgi:capsular exopolysaccharide synthesis family protein